MDSDGFIPVRYSRRGKRKKNRSGDFLCHGQRSQEAVETEIDYNKDVALRKISGALRDVQESVYYKCFLEELETLLRSELDKSLNDITRIVCYGLGSLCRTTKSIEQFALLTNLQKRLKIPMEFFDPVFTAVDRSILCDEFQYDVIEVNEQGRRKVEDLTLFCLPHCPHMLSNNLVRANWNPADLKNCIIFSNGFSKVLSNSRNSKVPPYNYMSKAAPITKELVLVNSFIPMDVFNDISIHVFPPSRFGLTGIEIWDLEDSIDEAKEDGTNSDDELIAQE